MRAVIVATVLIGLAVPVSVEPVQYTVFIPLVSGTGNHRGVGAIHQYPYTCSELEMTGAAWFHDWLPYPKDCPGIKSVCMWWGLQSMDKPTNPNCDTILLWNEPQIAGQSNIPFAIGAERWPEVEEKALGRQITTPCADGPYRDAWAHAFYATNDRWPRFDYVCIHSYPHLIPPRTVQNAITQTKQEILAARAWSYAHGSTTGQVWLHEFALWPAWESEEATIAYVKGIVPWLETQRIPYAWFGLRNVGDYMAPPYDTSLVEGGELTAIGEAYAHPTN